MQALPQIFFLGAPLLILLFMPAVLFALSRLGWAALATRYRSDAPFEGERIGIVTGAINTTNYKNCLLLKFDEHGIYLKPVFIFRIFHPPLFIPRSEISMATAKDALFGRWKELSVGHPEIATITIPEAAFQRMRQRLNLPETSSG